MGIFSPNGYGYSEPLDIENMTYDECAYENPFEAASYIVAESENNYNNIMKAIALDELACYESTGQELVYEAGNIKSFLQKVKEFFKKLWEKIKGMFQKFFAKLNSVMMSDKEFVKKYKQQLLKVKTTDFEFKGFKFTKLDDSLPAQNKIEEGIWNIANISNKKVPEHIKELTDYANKFEDDKKTDLLDTFRGSLVGQGKVEDSEFSNELFMYFRNGEETKDTIDKFDVTTDLLNVIEKTNETKKKAEKDLKDLKKIIDALIKDYDKAEKDDTKETPTPDVNGAAIKAYAATSAILKGRMDIVTLWSGAKLKALKDQNAQAKSVCVKLLTYKPKNESAGFVHTEGGSYLDSVVFK